MRWEEMSRPAPAAPGEPVLNAMKRDDERAVNARTFDLLELAQSIGEVADETGGWPRPPMANPSPGRTWSGGRTEVALR